MSVTTTTNQDFVIRMGKTMKIGIYDPKASVFSFSYISGNCLLTTYKIKTHFGFTNIEKEMLVILPYNHLYHCLDLGYHDNLSTVSQVNSEVEKMK